MDTSQGESNQNDPNPMDYVTETKNFRVEALKSVEIQERHKKEALAKCSDLHNKLLDCYDKRRFCGTVEKEFWDCYRNERVCVIIFLHCRVLRNPRYLHGLITFITKILLKINKRINKSFIIIYYCFLLRN